MIKSPNWVVPSLIQSAYTTRVGGVSSGAYESLNLGDHVADDPENVIKNRSILKNHLHLPSEPRWLSQVHGSKILNLDLDTHPHQKVECDASFTTLPGKVCVVMTADCLPLLLCDEKGSAIAAVHCGWRSLADGIIEKTITLFKENTDSPLIAWLGPAIGPDAFEVGEDMRSQFSQDSAFVRLPSKDDSKAHYLANIYSLATSMLLEQGVLAKNIYQTANCTYNQPDIFYSYRRDKVTGRMASLIWMP